MIEISGAISAVSATVSALKTAVAVRDEAKIEAAMSDLKDRLIDLQSANLELVQKLHTSQAEVHALIEERNQLKAKLRERGLYALFNLAKGTNELWAYRYKGNDGGADGGSTPIHYLCQACFDNDRKSVLRRYVGQWSETRYSCGVCKTDANV